MRGLVAGSVLRFFVAKTIVAAYGPAIEAATAPFQFALSTRAGTDAVGQALRLLSDRDPNMVIVSLDGIGAFDHVRRSAFMQKLLDVPSLHALIPFVRMWYDRLSCFLWTDDDGEVHQILQGEGGEQGDPLMPALFALAQHDSLATAAASLRDGEHIFAFLDDLYLATTRERASDSFARLASEVERGAGVRTHMGKL